jgi:hypothetical protein
MFCSFQLLLGFYAKVSFFIGCPLARFLATPLHIHTARSCFISFGKLANFSVGVWQHFANGPLIIHFTKRAVASVC